MDKNITEIKQINQLNKTGNNNVYTWGFGKTGSLGTGKENSEAIPICIKFKENITSVSSGLHTSMCLTEDGNIYAFGCNKQGRIGLNSGVSEIKIPLLIKISNNKITKISCGKNHSLAVNNFGIAFGTGYNKHGELGLNDNFDRLEFTQINIKDVNQISAGSISLFLDFDNKIYSCGKSKLSGFSSGFDITVPTLIKGFENEVIVSISSGYTHSACVNSNGQIYTWGEGSDFQLGHGNKKRQQIPKLIENFHYHINQISCSVGEKHCHTTCVDKEGNVFSWGSGYKCKLGHGDTKDISTPKQIQYLIGTKVIKCFSGGIHTAVLTQDNKCLTFGCGSDGRLGHKESEDLNVLYKESKPREIEYFSNKNVIDLSCSYYHCIALVSN